MRTCDEVMTALIKDQCEFIVYLVDRWHDEWRYESIDEYVGALKKRVPEVTELQTDLHEIVAVRAECSDGTVIVRVFDVGNSVTLEGEVKAR